MAEKKRILIVDDEVDVHLSIALVIERLGFEPISVYDGNEAFKIIQDDNFSNGSLELIICDLHMDKMDGDELIKHIHENAIEIPIIVITGTADKNKVIKLLRLGIQDFIDKPFTVDELEKRIKHQINKKSILKAEKENTESLARIGEVAKASFHDIHNVMGGVQMFTELILNDISETDPTYGKIVTLLKSNKRAMDICNDLLSIDPFDASRTSANIDFVEIVNGITDILKSILPNSINVISCTPMLPIWVNVNVWQIKHILLNLAFNAKDAMPHGGVLSIELKSFETEIEISIKDTGNGIDPSLRDMLFEDGFTTKVSGHGIGLANVKKIIDEHNGSIKVDSEIGNGTCFTINFPRLCTQSSSN